MGNRRIILELDREPQDLQAVWRLDSIARLIQQALTIRNGWVILEGEVEWWYQKNAAEVAVRHLSGVRGVSNSISIKSTDIANAKAVRTQRLKSPLVMQSPPRGLIREMS